MTLRISVFLAVFLLNVTVQAQVDDPGLAIDKEVREILPKATANASGVFYAEKIFLLRAGKAMCEYGIGDSRIYRRCISELMEASQTSNFKVFENLCKTAVPLGIIRMAPAKPLLEPPSRTACLKEAKKASDLFAGFRARQTPYSQTESRAAQIKAIAKLPEEIVKASDQFRENPEKVGGLRPGLQ